VATAIAKSAGWQQHPAAITQEDHSQSAIAASALVRRRVKRARRPEDMRTVSDMQAASKDEQNKL